MPVARFTSRAKAYFEVRSHGHEEVELAFLGPNLGHVDMAVA